VALPPDLVDVHEALHVDVGVAVPGVVLDARWREETGGVAVAQTARVSDDIELCRSLMGDLLPWLEAKVGTLGKQTYKGKKLKVYLDDVDAREELYEDGIGFRTDYAVDDKVIGDKLKKVSTVTDAMKRRRSEELRAAG
jgi:hypothetical protein